MTVQVEAPVLLSEVGLQDNPLSETAETAVIDPPVPVVVMALASRAAESVLVTPMEVVDTLAAMVTLMVATTPLAMVLVLAP